MRKILNLAYYVVFVAGLWIMSLHFRTFVEENGFLLGLFVALVVAFLIMLLVRTVWKVLVFLIVVAIIIFFLISVEFFVLPEWAYEMWNRVIFVRELF